MTSLTDGSQGNLKKVLRTAFVGVKPADQVMLKGYLRVLLRLEADLEWVSANHAQVDLFMISDEFREAASVQKLLATQVGKPVMYVQRTDTGEGGVIGDVVILPLKQVTQLNDWLSKNVGILNGGVAATVSEHIPAAKSQPAVPCTSTPTSNRAPVATSETHETAAKSTEPSSSQAAVKSQSHPTVAAEDYQAMIGLIKSLQKKPMGLFELTAKGEVAAIIEPSSGRLWQTQHTAAPVLSLTWQLLPFNGARPPVESSQDINQWLWNRAWTRAIDILPLVSDSQSYRLRYWIKPRDSDDRRELLRIMTALETAPRTISQLAAISETSEKTAKKAVAGLLLAGSLQADSYEQLEVNIGKAATATEPAKDPLAPEAKEPAKKLSPLESVLARRESGEAASMPSSTYDSTQPSAQGARSEEAPAKVEMQQERKGFLSRLRSKLGL